MMLSRTGAIIGLCFVAVVCTISPCLAQAGGKCPAGTSDCGSLCCPKSGTCFGDTADNKICCPDGATGGKHTLSGKFYCYPSKSTLCQQKEATGQFCSEKETCVKLKDSNLVGCCPKGKKCSNAESSSIVASPNVAVLLAGTALAFCVMLLTGHML